MLAVQTIVFAGAWWLGLYLLQRDAARPVLRRCAAGLLAYALVLALDALRAVAPPDSAALPARLIGPLVFVPAVCWLATLHALRPRLAAWRAGPRAAVGVVIAATLMFALGVGLLLLPLSWLPSSWVLLAIGGDLALLGYAVGVLDAFDLGESLLPDFMRSLAAAALVGVLLGGQVGWAILAGDGVTLPLATLLFLVVATAIGLQTTTDFVQGVLDRAIFPQADALRAERDTLRATAGALPRRADPPPPAFWEAPAFARQTRRALSHLGQLPRLATSPLLQLPIVTDALAARGQDDGTLARAAALKLILVDAIGRLKPPDGSGGTTDAWRYFNVLYYPYVVGLKPGRRGTRAADLDGDARAVLAWLREQVPERTLYNWQNAAAELVAHDLREQCRAAGARETA